MQNGGDTKAVPAVVAKECDSHFETRDDKTDTNMKQANHFDKPEGGEQWPETSMLKETISEATNESGKIAEKGHSFKDEQDREQAEKTNKKANESMQVSKLGATTVPRGSTVPRGHGNTGNASIKYTLGP